MFLPTGFSGRFALQTKATAHEEEEEYQEPQSALLHFEAHEDGGIACTNQKSVIEQRRVIADIVKRIGKQLLSGKLNLINTSFPVTIFEPRSFLQKITDVWVFPKFLRSAAATSDPVQRLKLVTTYFVAGLQFAFSSWRKPFNPILGETWQANMSDGSHIHIEQISHHPPITAFQLVGPDDVYCFYGMAQPEVSAKLHSNAVQTRATGFHCIRFPDDTIIQVSFPVYSLKGLLYTQAPRGEVEEGLMLTDHTHQLQCSVSIGKIHHVDDPLLLRPEALSCIISHIPQHTAQRSASPFQRLQSAMGARRLSSSSLSATIGQPGGTSLATGVPNTVLAHGTGNWLSHLDWDGSRYWTLVCDAPSTWTSVPEPLPSDSRFREDIRFLRQANIEAAQQQKERLEYVQRKDAKLRKLGASEGS